MSELNFFGGCSHGGTEVKAVWGGFEKTVTLYENNNRKGEKCRIRLQIVDIIKLANELQGGVKK